MPASQLQEGRETAAPARALAGSAALMASGTLVSRILGLVRNVLLVAVLGVTFGIADAWSVANRLPNVIAMLLAGGILNAVLVPQVVRALQSKDGGTAYVNRLLTVGIVILGGLTVVLTAAASLLVTLYAAASSPEWKAVTVALAYWCIPQLFFYGLYTLLGQVLNAKSVFGPYMWAPALNNVVAIAGLVAFLVVFGPQAGTAAASWDDGRTLLLAGTATLGVAAQALILIIPLRRTGFRFRPSLRLRGYGLGRASRVATWAFAALALGQLGYLAVSNLAAAASRVGVDTNQVIAGNFAYDNAFLVFMLPQSLVTVSLVTALFTRLSSNAVGRAGGRVRDDLSFGLRTLSVFTVLATAAFMVLAIPLVQAVTLDRADNGLADYRAVGAVLVALSAGLVAMGIWTMVQRVFYAYEDTRTLFRIQAPMAAVVVIGSAASYWLLDARWWVVGAAASMTLSTAAGALVGYLATRMYLPSLDGARVLRTHLRVTLAVLPPALAAWGLLHLWGVDTTLVGALVRIAVLGTLIVVGYLLLLRVLGVSELDGLLVRARAIVSRRAPRGGRAGGSSLTTMTREMSEGGETYRMSSGTSTTLDAGSVIANRYRLDRPLTEDAATGAAWAAQDLAAGRQVRVLLLHGPSRSNTVDAARRAAFINDPRLPRMLRAGLDGDLGFIISDPADGTTLSRLLEDGPLAPSQARALVGEAAQALEAARRRGVHHLALSPAALRVTADSEVRLTGLGVDAAWRGTDAADSAAAARRDAVGLVELLYAALTARWPGDPELAGGLVPAPRHGDHPAPAGDLVDTVPNDLDTLCAVTLGGHDDGPTTPGQLVADLAPWEDIDLVGRGPLPPVVTPPSSADVVPDPTAAMGGEPGALAGAQPVRSDPTVEALTQTRVIDRAAIAAEAAAADDSDRGEERTDTDGATAPVATGWAGAAGAAAACAVPRLPVLVHRPQGWDIPGGPAPESMPLPEPEPQVAGQPAPAAPDATAPSMRTGTERQSRGRDAGTRVAGAARGLAAAASEASDGIARGARDLFGGIRTRLTSASDGAGRLVGDVRSEFDSGDEDEGTAPTRFNPTPVALFVMIALVIFALVMAMLTLRDAASAFQPGPDPGAEPPPSTAPATEEPTPEPEPEEPVEGGIPAAGQVPIVGATTFDPTVEGGENQDQAYFAYDGNPETTWNSLRYNSPTYGMKEGLGFTVELAEPARISSVTLNVRGAGGLVEVRTGDAANPAAGEILASGEMGPNVVLELAEPLEADSLSLWFPALPVAESDGRNRIELAEITLG